MIRIKSVQEIEIMAEGGRGLAGIMERLKKEVRPGIRTQDLDKLAQELILRLGGEPSFKNYRDRPSEPAFPAALCVSINDQIVHAVPSERILKEGEIVSLDLGLFYQGFHTDMAVTLGVGEIEPAARRLIRVTKKALKMGIKKARPAKTFGDIGNTIGRYVESQGFNVVRDLCGHGIGRELHEEPQVFNYGQRQAGPVIKAGMTFCIEPMAAIGDWQVKKTTDGFGYQTRDGLLSAHFEHTVAVTPSGPRVLTKTQEVC